MTLNAFGAHGRTAIVRSNLADNLSMKIFDFKKREAFKDFEISDGIH